MADKTLNVKFKQRYDTEANWKSKNPFLLDGEIAITDDVNGYPRFKIGNGINNWSDLDYVNSTANQIIVDEDNNIDVETYLYSLNNRKQFAYNASEPTGQNNGDIWIKYSVITNTIS